ncbi:TetR/AcrR family transcriptional regulator [Novosphingobium sp. P6W]|uniref:TetR/AcrR family transcriptional regulator n=1 Tax=Novosphingobium sp. P6W TaxID=1609758 RepID=UPI0005C2CF11|nr:TetR/AcrR family transcriptional regulator [Novosphingobium sp. P6W]KIS30051.1 hypothetical protein TQ38_24875 [Novosphingobium sp. P6W]
MSGAGGRPTKAQAAARNDALLDAARLIFCKRGFAAASIEEIASSLRWSKHTVYSRHSGKIELLEAVVARDVERFVAALEAAKRDDIEALLSLRAMARAYFGFSVSPGYSALYAAVALEAASSERLRGRLVEWASTSLAPLRAAIERATCAENWGGSDAEEGCAILIDLLDGEANRVKWTGAAEDEEQVDRRFDRRWRLFLRATAAEHSV